MSDPNNVQFFKAWCTEYPEEGHWPLRTVDQVMEEIDALTPEDSGLTLIKVEMTPQQYDEYMKSED